MNEHSMNLKYGRFVLWCCVGSFFVALFIQSTLRALRVTGSPIDEWMIYALLALAGAALAFVVWNDIAKNGIRTARMIVPGILCAGALSIPIFVGLVQLCLAKNHGRRDLKTWGSIWIVLGLVIAALAFAASAGAENTVAYKQTFSCHYGEPRCIDYGDKVVDGNAKCFSAQTCSYDGFMCVSDCEDQLRRLRNSLSDLQNCIWSSGTLQEAQDCASYY